MVSDAGHVNHPPEPRTQGRANPFRNQIEAELAGRHLIRGIVPAAVRPVCCLPGRDTGRGHKSYFLRHVLDSELMFYQ